MHSIAWWPTVLVLAVSTFTDLRSRRIPNWLVLPFLAIGLVVSIVPKSWHGIGIVPSLEGMGLGLLLFGALAFMGGMGMGDVKLCAAIGAWVGPRQLFVALVLTGIAGVFFRALALTMVKSGAPRRQPWSGNDRGGRRHTLRR